MRSDGPRPHSQAIEMSSLPQLIFGDAELAVAQQLVDAALHEDLNDIGDLTVEALIDPQDRAEVHVVARKAGVVAGLPIGALVFAALGNRVAWIPEVADGSLVEADQVVARVVGSLKQILIGERTTLNFLTHLSGIASLTQQFVREVAGTRAVILDTRKTLPGWRLLAKYAVRAGGGTNHRFGLYDGLLIKDNHIAAWSRQIGNSSLAEAIKQSRENLAPDLKVEIEVDTLSQLQDALDGKPDIVLLDNMSLDQLRQAVEIRNNIRPATLLEASGGVTLATVRGIAECGVDRISIGALTHSAPGLDLAFDFFSIER